MSTIVHDIEPNGGNDSSQQDTFGYGEEYRRCEENKMNIQQHKNQHQEYGFYKQLIIAGGGFANFFKVFTDSFLQFRMEGMWRVDEFRRQSVLDFIFIFSKVALFLWNRENIVLP
jgi:hypothetical protein